MKEKLMKKKTIIVVIIIVVIAFAIVLMLQGSMGTNQVTGQTTSAYGQPTYTESTGAQAKTLPSMVGGC